MRPTTLFALGLLVATTLPALAGGPELTPFIAYRAGGTIDAELTPALRDDVDVEDGEAYGVIFDIPLGNTLQLELLASRQDSQLEVDGGLFDDDRSLADVTIDYYHVGLLWQASSGQVNPFVVVSGGITKLDPNFPGASSETRPSLGLGGGVKVFVNQHLGFRFEGRGYFTDLEEDDDRDRDDHWEHYDDEGDDFTQGEARVGLIVRF